MVVRGMAPSPWLRAMFVLAVVGIASARGAEGPGPTAQKPSGGLVASGTDLSAGQRAASHDEAQAKARRPAEAETAVGEPRAPGMMQLLHNEIVAGLRSRGVEDSFASFQTYLALKLDSHGRAYTGSELTGNCRLSWYEHMLRNPLTAPAEAEEFTREAAHGRSSTIRAGWPDACRSSPRSWTCASGKPRPFVTVKSPQEALDVVKQALVEAQTAYAAALAPLDQERNPASWPQSLSRPDRPEQRRPHAQRPRHRPAAVRPDGEDGPRRDVSPPPRPWCR